MTTVDCVLPAKATLGEGAWWDHIEQKLWWVDIREHSVNCFDPEKKICSAFDVGEPVAFVFRREQGGLLIGTESGIYFFRPQTRYKRFLGRPKEMPVGTRFNDGCTDALGRLWAGTMLDDGGPGKRIGGFFRFDSDHSFRRFFDPCFITNGLAFSPDCKKMYFADTHRSVQRIWTCDYDLESGQPRNCRLFLDCNGLPGRPDGATVDAEGCYWFAGVGGWSLIRVTPSGKIDQTIRMPVEKPSKVMFGGSRLDTLYVTSISERIEDSTLQPEAGGVFAVSGLRVGGVEQHYFRG